MNDLISRQAAIDALERAKQNIHHNIERAIGDAVCGILDEVENGIKQLPPVNNSENPNSLDCISRQAAINAIDKCYCGGEDSCGEPWIYKENAVEAIQMIEPIPSAEPKKGKWIKSGKWGRVYKCNQCGNFLDFDGVNAGRGDANFCPNCGADMREVTE